MSYTVLARKYRPQAFDELVGQEHVARTLKNAIATGRVAHAFLFTGARGVGKTTTARVLAMALNCEKGPAPEPCHVCDHCKGIAAGTDVDVQEIDGASNNSVDDVRRLQETLPYRPARGRFKIVIVDEVHMLSTGAFNAFLKTLEEPPPHVKFIFATTESHKVPITIRSRCQRYDFRLMPQSVVAEAVRAILVKESIKADDGAVALVAREAAGSMRDALTLLDQLVAFGGNELVGADVARKLGIADRKHVHDAARAVLAGDAATVLQAVDGLAQQGVDMLHFARQLLELCRDLVVLAVAGDHPELVDLVEEERRSAMELARAIEPLELQRAFSALARLVEDVGRSPAQRTVLEMGLVRIATRPPLRPVGELLARLDALEKRLGNGSPPGGGGGSRRREGPAAEPGPTAPGGSKAQAQPEAPHPHAQQPQPPHAQPQPPPHAQPPPQPQQPPRRPQALAAAEAAPPLPPAPPFDAPTPVDVPAEMAAIDHEDEPVLEHVLVHESDVAPQDRMSAWERIVAAVRESRPAVAAVLEHGVPRVISPERVAVGFPPGSFYATQADAPDARDGLAAAAAAVLGGRPAIDVHTDEQPGDADTMATLRSRRRAEARAEMEREALGHPIVVKLQREFPEATSDVHVED